MRRQLYTYHPKFGFTFIPGLKARVRHEGGGYLIRVNDSGFRSDRTFESVRPAGKKRLLVFGDSFTAGEGASDGSRYTDMLEELVPAVEVLNFGLPSSGTDQQYLIYQEFAHRLEHDLVVIAVMVENIRRNPCRYRTVRDHHGELLALAKPYFELVDGRLLLRHVPPPKRPLTNLAEVEGLDRGGRFPRLRELLLRLGLKELSQKVTRYQPLPEYGRPRNVARRLLRAILVNWISGHAARVLLLPIPTYHYVEELSNSEACTQFFETIAAETGCTLHDPLPDFRQHSGEQRRAFRFAHDPHLTPQGHRCLAESLAPTVARLIGA